MAKRDRMRSRKESVAVQRFIRMVVISISCTLGLALIGSPPSSTSSGKPTQQGFPTPDKAAQALIQAAKMYDVPALLGILGPDGKDLVSSEDPVQDKNRAMTFAKEAEEKTHVSVDSQNPRRALLSVGYEDWPFPIPIIQRDNQWYFYTPAGRREILLRRIGANELDAIQVCRGYVEAQNEYALSKHGSAGIAQYAQRIIATKGNQDGLAWQNADGSWSGPVGPNAAKALQQGYTRRDQPYHGYYFKILKGQGPAAPLGLMDYVVKGLMIGGFALAAAPAQYRVTGVQTFIVGNDGIVYQKDLGPNTLLIFKAMQRYNPDKSWHPTDEQW